jgi:hypothetical protein
MNKLTRFIVDIIIFVAVISAWWHVALLISIIGLIAFPYFIEIIIFGIIFDALFGYSQSLGISGYIGTLSSILIFLVIFWLNKTLRR